MKVRRISKTLLILIINIAVLVGTVTLLGIVSINRSTSDMTTLIRQRVLDIANSAAASVDGDYLAKITAEDEGTDEYQAQYDALAKFRDNAELEYIYVMRSNGSGGFNFILDPTIDVTASAFTDITDVIGQVSDRAGLIKNQSNDLGDTVSKYNA